jgi:hypothetical protein
MNATEARNTKLLSGELRGFRNPTQEADLTGCTSVLRRSYRVPGGTTTEIQVPDPCVVFMATLNGADGAQTYVDEAGGAIATFAGGFELDTAQAATSSASSLRCDPSVGPTAIDDGIYFGTTNADWARWDLRSALDADLDITMEFQVRFNSLTEPRIVLFNKGDEDARCWTMEIVDTGGGVYEFRGSWGYDDLNMRHVLTAPQKALNVWHHVALQKRGSWWELLWDGQRVVNIFYNFLSNPPIGTGSGGFSNFQNVIMLGCYDSYFAWNNGQYYYPLDGWLDNVRVCFGEATYDVDGSNNYVVPTVEPVATLPQTVEPTNWLCFNSRDVDVVRSPLVNDSFDRYYWAGVGERPQMNTADRIHTDLPPYWLGIPIPVSPPTIAIGADTGTWEITNLPTAAPDAGNRAVDFINIYRTVPGNASTSFFHVAKIAITAGSYSDNITNEDAANNPILESTFWAEPPSTIEGLVVMPNGYLVGWAGRRLLFSEPYRPHAWPAEYELSTEFDIVGLAVFGSTLVICTESHPYFGQGVSPASFTTQKLDSVEPCLSRRSIVSMTVGVIYASINGLVLANSSGVQTITQDIVTKAEWDEFSPTTIYASQLGLQYIAFNSPSFGFIFDPQNPMSRLVELDNFSNVEGIETDRYTGNVQLLAEDRVWNWDPETSDRLQWRWQSKQYQYPKPMNFGAARLLFDIGEQSQSLPIETVYRPYNEALFTAVTALPGTLARLNTLGGVALGGTPAQPQLGLVPTSTLVETHQPLGGSLLYNLAFLQFRTLSVRVRINVQAKGKPKKWIFDKQIVDESIFRLPTGFKSDLWQFELTGNTTVYSLQIAETPNGLAEV